MSDYFPGSGAASADDADITTRFDKADDHKASRCIVAHDKFALLRFACSGFCVGEQDHASREIDLR